jgi:hypothetical protein
MLSTRNTLQNTDLTQRSNETSLNTSRENFISKIIKPDNDQIKIISANKIKKLEKNLYKKKNTIDVD